MHPLNTPQGLREAIAARRLRRNSYDALSDLFTLCFVALMGLALIIGSIFFARYPERIVFTIPLAVFISAIAIYGFINFRRSLALYSIPWAGSLSAKREIINALTLSNADAKEKQPGQWVIIYQRFSGFYILDLLYDEAGFYLNLSPRGTAIRALDFFRMQRRQRDEIVAQLKNLIEQRP